MILPPPVQQELDVLLGKNIRVEPIQDAGLSKALVFRVDAPSGAFALRRWPMSTLVERVEEVQRFQQMLANAGLPYLPHLMRWTTRKTYLEISLTFWELSQWKNGKPIAEIDAISDGQLEAAIDMVIELHDVSRQWDSRETHSAGLRERERRLKAYLDGSHTKWKADLAPIYLRESGKILEPIAKLISLHAAQGLEDIRVLAARTYPCHWILRDLWREHLLYIGDRLTGVVDFGASRFDTPMLDLARMLGSLMLPSDPRWADAVDRYNTARTTQSVRLDDLRVIDRVSVLVSGLNWLEWIASGQLRLDDREGLPVKRLVEIYQRLLYIDEQSRQ